MTIDKLKVVNAGLSGTLITCFYIPTKQNRKKYEEYCNKERHQKDPKQYLPNGVVTAPLCDRFV